MCNRSYCDNRRKVAIDFVQAWERESLGRGVFDDASGEKFGNLSLNFKLLFRAHMPGNRPIRRCLPLSKINIKLERFESSSIFGKSVTKNGAKFLTYGLDTSLELRRSGKMNFRMDILLRGRSV